eukprot:373381_1
MKLRKQRLKPNKQIKRCGTLSQICVILLCLLVVFYVTVASYLIKPSSRYKQDDHLLDDDHRNNFHSFIQIAPAAPKIDSYAIPNVPKHKFEDKKYAPPHFDSKQEAEYIKSKQEPHEVHTQTHNHKPMNEDMDIPSQALIDNDYSDLERIERQYR